MRTFLARLIAAPSYPPDPIDLRTFALAGLRLPVLATVAITVVVFAVIFDFSRTFIPDELISYDRNPLMQRLQAIDRLVLYALVPLAVIVVRVPRPAGSLRPPARRLAVGSGADPGRLRGDDADRALVRRPCRTPARGTPRAGRRCRTWS